MFELQAHWDTVDTEIQCSFPHLLNASDCIDPVQTAADFYILFGLRNRTIVDFPLIEITEPSGVIDAAITLKLSYKDLVERNRKFLELYETLPSVKLSELSNEADDQLNNLINLVEPVFIDYANAAVGGELRHHQHIACLGKGSDLDSRMKAWGRWGAIFKREGNGVLLEAVKLFKDFPVNSSYGGEAWANAAQLVHDRLEFNLANTAFDNSCIFLDRIFNMQHNTGSFLNKLSWVCLREAPVDEGIHMMHETVLKAHGLNPPDLDILASRASTLVRDLLNQIIVIARENNLGINATYGEINV